MKLSRRSVARALVTAPLVLAGAQVGLGARAAQTADPEASPTPAAPEDSSLGRLLAKEEEGLTAGERRKVRRQVAQLEQSLKEIRDFTLTNDVPPSGTFRALRTRRTHGR